MGKGTASQRLVLSETPPDPELAELIRARTVERLAEHGVRLRRPAQTMSPVRRNKAAPKKGPTP